jgi:hypothetical protein
LGLEKGGSSAGDDQLNSIAIYNDYTYLIGYIQGTGTIDSTSTSKSSNFTQWDRTIFSWPSTTLRDAYYGKKPLVVLVPSVVYGLNIHNNILW